MSKFENNNPDFGQDYLDIKHKRQRELGIILLTTYAREFL
jgi:uncharacterized protein